MSVIVEKNGPVTTVILSRPERRNAVDRETAQVLTDTFAAFDADPEACVGVLYGDEGQFCSGADLKAIAEGNPNRLEPDGGREVLRGAGFIKGRDRGERNAIG